MELTAKQIKLLRSLNNNPNDKVEDVKEYNYLASLGLCRHVGGLRYEITNYGREIAYSKIIDKDLIIDKKY